MERAFIAAIDITLAWIKIHSFIFFLNFQKAETPIFIIKKNRFDTVLKNEIFDTFSIPSDYFWIFVWKWRK